MNIEDWEKEQERREGVVWSFRDPCRLNMIGIDPKVFPSLLVTE